VVVDGCRTSSGGRRPARIFYFGFLLIAVRKRMTNPLLLPCRQLRLRLLLHLLFLLCNSSARQRAYHTVANMASHAISSSMILVIHDNMINGTNHIV
jgi:hypothetical protein